MKLSKLLLATAAATVLLGALVGTASAGRISSSSQTLRASFSKVTFQLGGFPIECPVILEGSLHTRTMAKTAGALIGYITRADLSVCGSATILRETLPWHVQYGSFNGTLPNISSINVNVIGASFAVRDGLITCLARSTTGAGVAIGTFNREAGGALTTGTISGSAVPTSCGINGRLTSSNGPLTVAGAATRITVTLI